MTDLLCRLGEALYGDRWQAPLARALGVNVSTVQDWRQGRSQPRPGVWADLLRLAEQRKAGLDSAISELRSVAVLPEAEFRRLAEVAEALQDAADVAEAEDTLRRLRSGEEEAIPLAVVSRIIDGEHPVRAFRAWRGLSAHKLAAAAGISTAYLHQIEAGKRDGTVAVLAKLAAILRVTIDDLVPAMSA